MVLNNLSKKDAEVEEDVVNVNVPEASKQTCCSNVDFKVFNYKLLKKPQFLEIMFSFLVLGFGVATTFSFTVVCINIKYPHYLIVNVFVIRTEQYHLVLILPQQVGSCLV